MIAVRRVLAASAVAIALLPATASANPPTADGVRAVLAGLADQDGGRVRVVVGLEAASLVDHARAQRSLAGYGAAKRVQVGAWGSRLYLQQLDAAQARVAATLRARVPGARIESRYRLVLSGFAVSLPAREVARLATVPGVARVYPNLRYHALSDTVPGVLNAPVLWGASPPTAGAGIKIGIIDDGIDRTNPFFAPAGLTAPAGFPRGRVAYTSGKVIVARAFAPPGAGERSRRPFDSKLSFHGTHVAGIAAGRYGTLGRQGGLFPPVPGLSGVAPGAWLGNYRGLAVEDPIYGAVGSTADLARAVESAVADGMDVINLSLGGVQIDPSADALSKAVDGASRAGVVVVVAAGNSFGESGDGSIESPGTARAPITVAATTTTRWFGFAAQVMGPGVPPQLASLGLGASTRPRVPESLDSPTRVRWAGSLCRRLAGKRTGEVLVANLEGCDLYGKALIARAAGAVALVVVLDEPGPPPVVDFEAPLALLITSDSDGAALKAYLAGAGSAARITVGRSLGARPGVARVVTGFSSGGPTPFDQLLKPDVAAPGQNIVSSVPASSSYPGTFATLDGTSMATPAVAGSAALLRAAHRDWTPRDIKAALMATATPAFADTLGTVDAKVLRQGAGFVDIGAAASPGVVADPPSLGLGLADGRAGALRDVSVVVRDLGGGAGDWAVGVTQQAGTPAGVSLIGPATLTVPAAGEATLALRATVPPGTAEGDASGYVTLTQGAVQRRVPYWLHVEQPVLGSVSARTLRRPGTYTGDTRKRRDRLERYRYPANLSGLGLPVRWRGPEEVWRFTLTRRVANAGVTIIPRTRSAELWPLLVLGSDENRIAGKAGMPLDVGPLPWTTGAPTAAAALVSPGAGTYSVAVESANARSAGAYELRYWVNDLTPPRIRVETRAVVEGERARMRIHITDTSSGVDPASLVVAGLTRGLGIGTPSYDPATGLAEMSLRGVEPGTYRGVVFAADYAQSKDVLGVEPTREHSRAVLFTLRVKPKPKPAQ